MLRSASFGTAPRNRGVRTACPPPLRLISGQKPAVGPLTSSYGCEQTESSGLSEVHFSLFSDAGVTKYNELSSEFGQWRRALLILLCLWRCQAAQLIAFSMSHVCILPPLRRAQEEAYDVIWDVTMIHPHVSSSTSALPELCLEFLINTQVLIVMGSRNCAQLSPHTAVLLLKNSMIQAKC